MVFSEPLASSLHIVDAIFYSSSCSSSWYSPIVASFVMRLADDDVRVYALTCKMKP